MYSYIDIMMNLNLLFYTNSDRCASYISGSWYLLTLKSLDGYKQET